MSQWSGIGLVEVEGSAREQGRAQGVALRSEIGDNLRLVERVLKRLEADGHTAEYLRLLRDNERFVARHSPDTLEEIVGIAAGSGFAYDQILALNLPVYQVRQFQRLECTQILLRGQATRDGSTLLAKTRDLASGPFHQVLIRRVLPSGRWVVEANISGCVTWPGIGINSDGLALSSSGAWSKRQPVDWARISEGWLLANTSELLRHSTSVRSLRDNLAEHPRLTPVILTAADRESAAVFETTATTQQEIEVSGSHSVRTNHYLSAGLAALAPTEREYPSTHHRIGRATSLIESRLGDWDIPAMAELMSDHDGFPQDSLCRHAQREGESQSLYSVMVRVEDGSVVALLGNPCSTLPLGDRVAALPATGTSLPGAGAVHVISGCLKESATPSA
ncbi:C45 family autoproteolytic acyltransferase/hydolase [Actinoallomurus iriomotensis]|uniref:Peptidase C45 hydrolase domain-containing protein n=1 Tax=Actinoallomurus iriomotensis TaxID=478107 RepID=A0A9W6RUX8_9ACTN|nr:C45 family peptidase [Actinoallomurus iriomotensis]GLY82138.1 hypothetical protein Airi02_000700 [Actinoallomurus iriomotensis]